MNEPSPAILEVHDLSRTSPLEKKSLLRGISLSVRPGDRIAVQGESGSGKTLLLRALAALDPSCGMFRWRGKQVLPSEHPRFRADICYLHQSPALPEGTVREALTEAFAWTAHQGKEFDETFASRCFTTLGRQRDFMSKVTSNLSGGEVQIVSLVRALLISPSVLLLDEPTSALDPRSVERVECLVCEWARQRDRAFIWVTHDASQAKRVAGRILLMSDGAISHA